MLHVICVEMSGKIYFILDGLEDLHITLYAHSDAKYTYTPSLY